MTTHDTEPLTYTVEQTKDLVGLGLNQTYEAIRKGELPSIRIGRRILVPRQKLLDMLNGDRSDATR
jgi:excisionase family DNA binding protein